MALITACIAIAAVASVFAWTIGEQAKQEARVASTNPSSYGPACDAYFSTVTSYEEALLENFSYECQVELAEARTRTAILQQSAEATSGRAKVAWLVAGAAALAAVGVWLAYYLEAARRGT